MYDGLISKFNKLTAENNETLRDLKDQGDELSTTSDKYNRLIDEMAKKAIGQKLLQISFGSTRDKLTQAKRQLMEQGDQLSKTKLELQIN